MRLTVLAVGSQGDVQPYAALAGGLAKAGFAVKLASHKTFREMAGRSGLDFAPIAGNPMDIVQGPEGQAWLNSTDSYMKFLGRARKLAQGLIGDLSRDALKAVEGSDALIFSLPLSISGYTVARALRIPGIPAALYPLHPTRAFPSIMTPDLSLGRGMNWLSGAAVMQLFWQLSRSLIGRWHNGLGMGRMPIFSPLVKLEKAGLPFLYGYSPAVIPRPKRWPKTRAVCGYWFMGGLEDWQPDNSLQKFMDAGPPPIYVGFGSMTSGDPGRMTQIILEAVRRTGQRAILSTGWGGFHAEDMPKSVLPVGFVSHPWLFPRVSMAIHHGGAGTTAAVLQAGVPSIIIPFFADQFFWGRRVRDLGVGAGPIPRKVLTEDFLEAAIRAVLDNGDMTARARNIAKAIEAEDGIAAAVAVVKDYLGSTAPRRMA